MPAIELTKEQLQQIIDFVPTERDWTSHELNLEIHIVCRSALNGLHTQTFRTRGIEYSHTCDMSTCELNDWRGGYRSDCNGVVESRLAIEG